MDNEKKLWFVAKRFGLGWRPVSWQGWIITAIYVIGLIHFAIVANKEQSGSDFLISFGFNFILLSIPFLIICYLKGERPKWHWGEKRGNEDGDNKLNS